MRLNSYWYSTATTQASPRQPCWFDNQTDITGWRIVAPIGYLIPLLYFCFIGILLIVSYNIVIIFLAASLAPGGANAAGVITLGNHDLDDRILCVLTLWRLLRHQFLCCVYFIAWLADPIVYKSCLFWGTCPCVPRLCCLPCHRVLCRASQCGPESGT